eukprot:jgi/Chrzof1/2090/Cz11g02120.t1
MVFGASVVAESKPPTKPNGTDLRLQAQRLLAATFPKVDRAVIAAACFSGEGKHSAMGRHFMACQLAGLWLDGECCGAAVFSVMTLPSAVGSEAECRSCLQVLLFAIKKDVWRCGLGRLLQWEIERAAATAIPGLEVSLSWEK